MRNLEIAYFFPRISETFVSDVVVGLSKLGACSQVYSMFNPSIVKAREDLVPEAFTHQELRKIKNKIWYEEDQRTYPTFKKLSKSGLYDVFHLHFGEMLCEIGNYLPTTSKVFATLHTKKHLDTLLGCVDSLPSDIVSRLTVLPTSDYLYRLCSPLKEKAKRVLALKLGVDTLFFSPSPARRNHRPITFLINGRFVEKKNHRDVIKSFSNLVGNGLDARLVIIGDGVLRDKLRKQVQDLSLQEKVEFVGKITRDQVKSFYETADIALQPSITDETGDEEGLPTSIMEYGAMGMPTIAYPSAGIPEIVVDNVTGLIAHNSTELVKAMIKLGTDAYLRKKLGSLARVNVEMNFNQNLSIKRLYQLYNES